MFPAAAAAAGQSLQQQHQLQREGKTRTLLIIYGVVAWASFYLRVFIDSTFCPSPFSSPSCR